MEFLGVKYKKIRSEDREKIRGEKEERICLDESESD
jgi:hypothetical protein